MNSDANIHAINNIGIMEQVSANNVANSLTTGYRAKRAIQTGDQVTISQEARNAAIDMNGQPMSTTDLGEEVVHMIENENSLTANVKAIQTRNEMDAVLLSIKK